MKRTMIVSLAALMLGAIGTARAEEKVSIKEKDARIYDEQQLSEMAKETDTACGGKITTTVDWASFKGVDRGNNSLSGRCGAPLEALSGLCAASASAKEAASKEVKKLVCHYGGKDKPAITVKNGTIDWTMTWEMTDLPGAAKEYLENNL